MNTEMIGIIATFIVSLLIAFPLGKYISKVLKGERTFTDFLNPLEQRIFRFCGIDPSSEMTWKQHLVALLSINSIWFVYAFFMLISQG
ncbi:MAG: potassium-transporting ATPase subunit KdpA, partial [Chryseobacterium sp.]